MADLNTLRCDGVYAGYHFVAHVSRWDVSSSLWVHNHSNVPGLSQPSFGDQGNLKRGEWKINHISEEKIRSLQLNY